MSSIVSAVAKLCKLRYVLDNEWSLVCLKETPSLRQFEFATFPFLDFREFNISAVPYEYVDAMNQRCTSCPSGYSSCTDGLCGEQINTAQTTYN